MTIEKAFTQWSSAPRNMALACKYRIAVEKVLMKEYGGLDLKKFTEGFCRRLLSRSGEDRELRLRAASVLVLLLEWGGDHGHCQRPLFTYDDIANGSPEPEDAAGVPPSSAGARTPRRVVQIDPETLQAVRVWDSANEPYSVLGIRNIGRAIRNRTAAGGFYWCHPEDAGTFMPSCRCRTVRKEGCPAEAPEPERTADAPVPGALEQYGDDELAAELHRRGWHVELTKTISL